MRLGPAVSPSSYTPRLLAYSLVDRRDPAPEGPFHPKRDRMYTSEYKTEVARRPNGDEVWSLILPAVDTNSIAVRGWDDTSAGATVRIVECYLSLVTLRGLAGRLLTHGMTRTCYGTRRMCMCSTTHHTSLGTVPDKVRGA